MTNIRKTFLNKNLIDELMDGSFWFGKNENKANLKIVQNIDSKNKINSQEEIKLVNIEDYKDENLSFVSLEKEDIIFSNSSNPLGYIELYMHNITATELFVNHNISMQYLTINGNKFIKELKLTNRGREIDCYSEGENKSLTIEKISSTQALLTLEELDGKLDKFIIINGAII